MNTRSRLSCGLLNILFISFNLSMVTMIDDTHVYISRSYLHYDIFHNIIYMQCLLIYQTDVKCFDKPGRCLHLRIPNYCIFMRNVPSFSYKTSNFSIECLLFTMSMFVVFNFQGFCMYAYFLISELLGS